MVVAKKISKNQRDFQAHRVASRYTSAHLCKTSMTQEMYDKILKTIRTRPILIKDRKMTFYLHKKHNRLKACLSDGSRKTHV